MNTQASWIDEMLCKIPLQGSMTRHASARVQQRGVRHETLAYLLSYGRHEPDHKGCQIVTFDSQALAELSRSDAGASAKRASDTSRLYAVVDSDGQVITTGHRIKRVPKDMSLSVHRKSRTRKLQTRQRRQWDLDRRNVRGQDLSFAINNVVID